MTRKVFLSLGLLMVVLVAIVVANTLLIGPRAPDVPAVGEIAVDKVSAARRLSESVRFRTVSHEPGAPVEDEAFRALHAFLIRVFPKVHAALKRETVSGYSLLYTWEGSDRNLSPILLMGHMDVVPVEPGTEADWSHPPFAGEIAGGFVWGRGTLDNKQAVMGLLEAAETLLGQGVEPMRRVYLAFGHDEEIGGQSGAAKIAELLAERGVRLDFVLDEGSIIAHGIVPGVARPAALIGVAEKGYVSLELTATAKGGHSARPPRATAVGKLARAIHRLESNQMPAALRSPAAELFEYLAPEMRFVSRAVVANRWLFDPVLLSRLEGTPAGNALIRTTTAPTIIQGGVKENVLPSKARAVVNFRILPGESVEAVIEHVRRAVGDPDIALRRLDFASEPSQVSDLGSASFAALHKTVRQVFPDAAVAPSLVLGATDSRHYAKVADNAYRFLPMRLGPEDLARFHGTNERIAVENHAEIIRFYIQLLRNAAVTPAEPVAG